MPYVVLAGAYFSGRFALGEFTQAAYAFSVLQSSMALVVDQFQALTDYASVVNRLAAFEEFCEKAASKQGNDQPQIEVVEDDSQVALKNVTLATPDWTRVLQQDVSFAVTHGDALLLTGPTGAGKTSLMGAVAGLWRAGSGGILRPSANHILFMPQKPYLILGSLRQQIQYPRAGEVSDETLMQMLKEVDLAYLPGRFGGLDAELNWVTCCRAASSKSVTTARCRWRS